MTGSGRLPIVIGIGDENTAKSTADALTYLMRVASDAGYHSVAGDILALRDRMNSIANAEEAERSNIENKVGKLPRLN